MTITFIVLAISALLFVTGRIRADLVAICAALALVLSGTLTPDEALAGFSNPIVIMMGGLFIVGAGIFSTGLAGMVGSRIVSLAGRSETRLFILIMLATSLVGAFVSNTGTVALMLPIVVSMSRAAGIQSSRLLMPLAFAGSMGGMLTLIGTPPNLIVRDVYTGAGHAASELGFFSFTPVGIVCVIVGIVCLLPLSKRFLTKKENGPDQAATGIKSPQQLVAEYRLDVQLAVLRVGEGSPVIGQTVKQLNVHGRYGVNVMELRRHRRTGLLLSPKIEQYSALGDVPFAEGDMLYVSGAAEEVDRMADDLQLVNEPQRGTPGELHFYDVGLAEILLLPSTTLAGKTIREVDFRNRFGVNVIGIRRHERYLLTDIDRISLRQSDIILACGAWKDIARLERGGESEWVVMGRPAEAARRVTHDYKAPLAAIIMAVMVVVMAVDSIPVAPVTAVTLAAVAMVASGCVRGMAEAYRAINWESIVLFATMLPMSTALQKTGASDVIAHSLVSVFGHGPYALMIAVYLATSLLTFFISNTVTAVLMAPIALTAAQAQGLSPLPFLMAVTVAASMCFASPFSTPPNALVMSAGGYRPVDYIKVGLPLQIVMGIVMVVVLPLLFPFSR